MKTKSLLSVPIAIVVFILTVSVAKSQNCPAGLISYWKLQESNTNVFADEMNHHDAITVRAPFVTDGVSGNAQLFSQSASLSIPGHDDFNWNDTSDFSIEFWVNYSNTENEIQVFIGRFDPEHHLVWQINKTPGGRISWIIKDSVSNLLNITTNGIYNNGQWHHVAAVRDGSTDKCFLYVDGIVQNAGGTIVDLPNGLSSPADISLGNIMDNQPRYFYNGAMDELAIYSVALTSSMVYSHYVNAKNYRISYCSGNSPEFVSVPVMFAAVSVPYEYKAVASGNPLPAYSLVSAPQGMTINSNTGVISWTPANYTDRTSVTIRATNTVGTKDQYFKINLTEPSVCRDALVAYWDFDQSVIPPYVDHVSGFLLNGSNPSKTTGIIDQGLSFDGMNDSLNMEDPYLTENFFDFNTVSSFSIELWVKSGASPTDPMVMVGRDETHNKSQFWLGINPNGTVGFYLSDSLAIPNTAYIEGGSVLDNVWHHVVATYNKNTALARLFVDKLEVASINKEFTNFSGNRDLNVGCLNTTLDKFWFAGVLDELAFYNKALADSIIGQYYDQAVAGKGACVLNYAPLIVSSPVLHASGDSVYNYTIIVSDLNQSDIINIAAVTKPAWMTFTYNLTDTFALLTGTPSATDVGNHSVKIRVSDGSVRIDQAFSVAVSDFSNSPEFTSVPLLSIPEDSLYSYQLTASDTDSDTLFFSALLIPEWLTFDSTTHVLSGTPAYADTGVWDISLKVSDGVRSDSQNYQLTVNSMNDLPVISETPQDTIEINQPFTYHFAATDEEGDSLVYSFVSLPSWLTFEPDTNGAVISGTPADTNSGSNEIVLKVNDGHEDLIITYTIFVSAGAVGLDKVTILSSVYPNPASQKVYFRFRDGGKSMVELYDVSGRLVLRSNTTDGTLVLDISSFAEGTYIYKAYQNNASITDKLIIKH